MSDDKNPENTTSDNNELELLLAQKVKLDSILMEKFSRKVTIMFTDIKGSTSYYETRGDLAGRTMIHQHNSIVLPIIEKNKGTLLKTIGDATMSLYEEAADGLRAATEIQTSLLAYNQGRPAGEQINVRCGLNSGIGMVENNDVYGDVVNVASRIESQASPRDIFLSEQIYEELRGDDEFIFRFVNAAKVKGKDEPIRIYRLVWNAEDLKLGKTRGGASSLPSRRAGYYHMALSHSGEKLKVSGSFQADGEVQPVKQGQEVPFDRASIDSCASRIIAIFNQAGGMTKVSNELLVELKQLGGRLYETLIPEVIRKGLAEAPDPNLLISMDESLVSIPWEMLHDGTQFLNQRFGIGRTVTTRQAVSGTTRAVASPIRMLLLCDPQGNLPAAARERQEILAATADYKEYLSVNAKDVPLTINYVTGRIHSYDIVHYAGHAEQDADQAGHGGWLLQDGPLTAAAISGLAGNLPMPALVFSNACHTGEWKTSEAFIQRVFSLANAFLLSGVQHYIGTFWDVPDEPSCLFATHFYGNLVQGMTVGEAMLAARKTLIDTFGEDTIFWASYLLYGDPTTRYVTGAAATESTGTETDQPPLLRSADSYAAAPPAKSSSTMMIAGGALVLACIVAGYFMFGGSKPQQVQVVQSAPQQDSAANDKQIDELVTSLAASYRSGQPQKPAQPSDGWTSPPFSIVIMEIIGGSDALIERINQGLSTNAGVSIVERKLLNKMLTELKLSASALTDPATSIKLGKILSARIMVTGSLSTEGGKATLLLKLIDTETTEVRKMLAIESKGKEIDKQAIADLAGQVGAWAKEEFPVQGMVTAVAANQCKLNIGRQHGLKKGDLLEAVIENGKGSGIYTVLCELQLSEVDKSSATAQVKGDGKGLAKDVRVRVKRG
ncbi:MAG: CHAT domain-containing protein [Geobacteraceae bacterium]|nr:CHAT domain-containing protein [Geobacteraceae bacterium]